VVSKESNHWPKGSQAAEGGEEFADGKKRSGFGREALKLLQDAIQLGREVVLGVEFLEE